MATETATLVVAWRTGKNTHARQVKATDGVIGHLLEVASNTDLIIEDGHGAAYDPDDEQGDRQYLIVGREDLLDPGLETEMIKGASLQVISTEEIKGRRLVGYGLVVGDAPEDRKLYLKRRNPVQMLTKSLITRFTDTLSTIEDPILAFDPTFDVVLAGDEIHAMHQGNFEALFKETEAVLALVDAWVTDLADRIPIKRSSADELAKFARANGVLRRKLHSVLRRNQIQNLTANQLKKALSDHGLDVAKLMPKKKLEITNATDAKLVLGLLNEDYWAGYFSQEQWSASRKSHR